MQQPQLIEVDPQRIKFNKQNPRKHGGEEYQRLKQSIQEMGIIQPPLVRHTTGMFYEVIDGEGRVSIAQELELPTIKVVNLGDVNEDDALEKLVATNVVREFGFFAYCKGLAALHRQGLTVMKIAKQLGVLRDGGFNNDLAIGYFPEQIFAKISNQIIASEQKATIWSPNLFYTLLPLRIVINEPRGNHDPERTLDGAYDYSEVHRAVDKVIEGTISNAIEMKAYVEQRRRELFEERFGKELQEQLDREIEQARQKLEEAKAIDIKNVEEGAKQRYEAQIMVLEMQKAETEKQYKALQAKITKGGDPETLKKELEAERKKTEEASKTMQEQMQELYRQEQERQRQEREQEAKALRAQIEKEAKERQELFRKEQEEDRKRRKEEEKKAKEDLDALYKDKSAKLQLKATTSYRQLVASASQHLAESQQSILTLISEGMLQGIELLSQEELGSLLFTMRAARNTLQEAEEAIRNSGSIPSTNANEPLIVENEVTQRSLVNHHG